jgi:pantoate--beta-alanine ligase
VELIQSIQELRQAVRTARSDGKRIGFVPTMGYLHDGHLALMQRAKQECDFIVVSIFVNPTQFGPTEDFARYPSDLAGDRALCALVPVDLLFAPTVGEMYPQPFLTEVSVTKITSTLCGASRPGHFTGVATVVSKLLNIVRPDVAYFGQKDAQQVAVIRRMVQDLNMDDMRIESVPIVREADGLAKSSRNVFLTPNERQAAVVLSRSLRTAETWVAQGERNLSAIVAGLRALIAAEPLSDIDYVEIVDVDTLQPIEYLSSKALVALAVRFGKTRLIDNVILSVE